MAWLRSKKIRVSEFLSDREAGNRQQLLSLRMILFIFGIFYGWPPENMDKDAAWWYRLKGIMFRVFFIYLCTASQVAYNFTVTTREELFASMFILLTQLVMIFKMEFFYKNMNKIQSFVRRLDGELYEARNAEERVPLQSARKKTTVFWILYIIFSDGLTAMWTISSFFVGVTLVPSWPPVDQHSPYWQYMLVLTYQFVSIILNAAFNISWDSLVAALLASVNAHLQRLQIQLMKVGHESDIKQPHDKPNIIDVSPAADQKDKVQINSSKDDVYDELLRCIIFHQELTSFLREMMDLFGGPMLAQLYCSIFIICITEFRLLIDINSLDDTIRAGSYLICLIIQVVQYCYFGNEVNYTSEKVHEATAFMNYPDMNIKTRKLLIAFQLNTSKGINCCAKRIFKMELSMATFVTSMTD
ncbi:odorant receptor Or1-like [Anopheles nili]|uniref:odorant receptor Or1-like n=1 Tax=Anopheles nili TaxID=185578 RepID=UPI00237BAEC5|nr:odorant receptor Or1-like [Anopheles nili]